MEAQVAVVSRFTTENFLKLNESKCEIIISGSRQAEPHLQSTVQAIAMLVHAAFPSKKKANALVMCGDQISRPSE